jgi:phage terminase Nu1 subunit (DNA packaging protein)
VEKSNRISGQWLTVTEVADLTEKPTQTVHDWTNAGLKSKKEGRNRLVLLPDLIKYLAAREYQPGSQRERLAKEQADKVAIENATKRGEFIFAGQVTDVFAALGADLAARHDAVPGRVASEFAGITEPAVIRSRLLDELRGVRAAFADAGAKLADALGSGADDGGDSDPAPEEERGTVGGREPGTATGKRRAGAVQKRKDAVHVSDS